MKKILVPTDFSTPAVWAIEIAASIAKKSGAGLTLLHIVEQANSESFNVEGEAGTTAQWEDRLFTFKLIERNKNRLTEIATDLQAQGLMVTSEIRIGNVFHGIKTALSTLDADLIVMGTAGHSRLEEVLIGSNTEKVVRIAKCPVLTIHRKPDSRGFRDIVCATALHESEKNFFTFVMEMQAMFESTIHLVRINTPMNFRQDIIAKEQLENFALWLHLKKYTVSVFNDLSEEQGILNFAHSIDASMIALTTHGRTGLAHILVHSIAEGVANHSSLPVLTSVIKE